MVEEWIRTQHKNNNRFDGQGDVFESEWYTSLNGVKLLDALIAEVTGQQNFYDKVQDSPVLTTILLEEERDALKDVAKLLRGLLEAGGS